MISDCKRFKCLEPLKILRNAMLLLRYISVILKFFSYFMLFIFRLWAVVVTAGNEEGGMEFNSIYSFFSLTIVLTDNGLNHIDEVCSRLFKHSYLHLFIYLNCYFSWGV